MSGLAIALAVAAPAPVSAATQTVTVVSGHALVGASPRFVKLSCALDGPLAAANAKLTYQASSLPGHSGKVAHLVPPADAMHGYGVVVSTPISGLTGLSVMTSGNHGMGLPVVQYPTTGGATMVGALATGNAGYGWTTVRGLDQSLNWIRYAHGVASMQGSAALSTIAARFPATGPGLAGFVFGCDVSNHDFELDDLVVGTSRGARVYDFETATVATRLQISSRHKVRVGKRVTLRGSLSPAAAGIPVGIYTVAHHKRHLMRVVRTSGAGRFSTRASFKHPGKVVWSAIVQPGQRWVSGASGSRTIKVRPKPRPKPKPAPVHHPVSPPSSGSSGSTGSSGSSGSSGPTPPPSGCTAVICSG
ncbi:hypothetical protein [Nocardioides nematodiphilus]|uniref:hypothetical protein n=1 Tax=Nocardioides nematodiphilus TaxID=2849669 RepID=UPI001CD9A3C9|nr:hypothetical protein [Nocardioides nematodiphilus]MCA1983169.1 hypothetical protein [Nocardioides nematodiphilus]